MSELLLAEIRSLREAIATLTGVVQSMASPQQTVSMSDDEEIAYVIANNIDPLQYLRERRDKQNAQIKSKARRGKACKSPRV